MRFTPFDQFVLMAGFAFAIVGFVAVVVGLIYAVYWLFTHVSIS